MRRRRGFLLPLAAVLCTIFMFMAFAMSQTARSQLQLAVARIRYEKAQAAADGGITVALAALAASSTYTGTTTPTTIAEGPESFTISVVSAGSLTPDGQTVPTGCVYVISTGISGNPVNPAKRTSRAMVRLGSSSSLTGLAGIIGTSVNLNGGCWVDSYNSALGLYLWGGTAGSVESNSTAAGSIQILGGSSIYGPVSTGVGSSLSGLTAGTNINTAATFWHDWGCSFLSAAAMTSPLTLPAVSMPALGTTSPSYSWNNTTIPPGSYLDVTVSNGAIMTLAPGTYVFRNLTLSGGSQISLSGSGNVQIYVTSSMTVSNGVSLSNVATPPARTQIYMGAGSTYTQNGGTIVSGVIYGPSATVNLSNAANVFGSVTGSSVTLSGAAAVHYDTSLSNFAISGSAGSSGTSSSGTSVLFQQRI